MPKEKVTWPRLKMGTCCVVPQCSLRSGTNSLSEIRSFRFPLKDTERCAQWVNAIKRENWKPTKSSRICSMHFITGKPAEISSHPDWIPSCFPFNKHTRENGRQQLERFMRHLNRHKAEESQSSKPVNNDAGEVAERNILRNDQPILAATPEETLRVSWLEARLQRMEEEKQQQEEQLQKSKEEIQQLQEKLQTSMAQICDLQARLGLDKNDEILSNDDLIQLYTGLPSKMVFDSLLKSILSIWSPQTYCSLAEPKQLLLVLMKLRMGLLNTDLAFRFSIAQGTVSKLFHTWLDMLCKVLEGLIQWPSAEAVASNHPALFQNEMLMKVRCIIDCTEIFIEKPSLQLARSQTYSSYKNHNTIKYLVAINTCGAITFISKAWTGRVSDKELTKGCGILDKLEEGDIVLADRGFNIEELLALKGVKLLIPAFTRGKTQLSATEVISSRKMSSVRVHVERAIGRLKNFRIFKKTLSLSFLKRKCDVELCTMDKVAIVCAALCNLQPVLIE